MRRKPVLAVALVIAIVTIWVFEAKRRAAFAVNAAANTKARIDVLVGGLWAFHAEHGRLPTESEGLPVLLGWPNGRGPISEYSPTDPPTNDAWGRTIRYEVREGTAGIRSAGSDGLYHTEDDIHESTAPLTFAPGKAVAPAKEMVVSARVIAQNGSPVSDAKVAVTYNSGPTFRGSTGADGKVSIKVPGDGYSSINVRLGGEMWVFGRLEFGDIKNVVLRLDGAHRSP